jgi:hypothetical protein
MRAALAVLLIVSCAVTASAQGTDGGREQGSGPDRESVGRFLAGAAAGFGAHEAGHLIAGVSFGASPRVRAIEFGGLPFFAIDHDPVTARRELVISSAGFWVQHAGSEWLLSTRPQLRHEHAPLLKGLLAFNLAASAVYGAAAFGAFGPPERDTRGIAVSVGKDGIAEPVVGALVLGPALLDGYRYLRPESSWAKWASRGLKVAGALLSW